MEQGRWPMNRLTPHQKQLAAGDRVLFYVVGNTDPDGYHIIGGATVAAARMPSNRILDSTPVWLRGRSTILYDIPLRDWQWLSEPISFRPLVCKLSFISNKSDWGKTLQGGVRLIPNEDFDLILEGRSIFPAIAKR
jgi:hypothetical protein